MLKVKRFEGKKRERYKEGCARAPSYFILYTFYFILHIFNFHFSVFNSQFTVALRLGMSETMTLIIKIVMKTMRKSTGFILTG